MVMTFPEGQLRDLLSHEFQQTGFPSKGFECQVNATHSDPKKSGGLYGVADSYDAHHKDNEWFLYEIIVQGKHVVLKINGQTTTIGLSRPQPRPRQPGRQAGGGGRGRVIDHGTMALQGTIPIPKSTTKDIMIKPLD